MKSTNMIQFRVRDRPSPYGIALRDAWRGTGPRPTVSLTMLEMEQDKTGPRTTIEVTHGEGQALALRYRDDVGNGAGK